MPKPKRLSRSRKPPADEESDAFHLRFDGSKMIEAATDIVPLWVAESVLNEAAAWLGTELPPEWAGALAARADRCFAKHRQFHRLISASGRGGNAGRDNLYKFMRHWLASRLARERPALCRRLPWSYALGRPLEHDRRGRRLPGV